MQMGMLFAQSKKHHNRLSLHRLQIVQRRCLFFGDIKITSSSVHLEWKTNIPTDSKIFLNQPDGSIKVISSASGNSTIHFVDITNLISGTLYNYTIEAIANNQVDKKSGFFSTNPDSPTRMVAELLSSDFLGLYCSAPSVQVKIFDQDNKEMVGQNIVVTNNLTGEIKSGQSPFRERFGLISIKERGLHIKC